MLGNAPPWNGRAIRVAVAHLPDGLVIAARVALVRHCPHVRTACRAPARAARLARRPTGRNGFEVARRMGRVRSKRAAEQRRSSRGYPFDSDEDDESAGRLGGIGVSRGAA